MEEMKVGARIAELRAKRNMTQVELAEKLNVSDKAVSKWETGGCYPDVTVFPQLADLFGVSIDYLMRGASRTVQHFKLGSMYDNGRFSARVNNGYLANGWKVVDVKLAGDGDCGGCIAVVLEKEIYDE